MSKGLSRGGFDVDLKFGESRESAFVEAVTRATVECKSDQLAKKTGNAFIEIEQKGRPSGIQVSTADFWATEVDKDCWVINRTSTLREKVKYHYEKGHVRRGGDFNNYVGVLVPIKELLSNSVRPDEA